MEMNNTTLKAIRVDYMRLSVLFRRKSQLWHWPFSQYWLSCRSQKKKNILAQQTLHIISTRPANWHQCFPEQSRT